MLIAAEMLAEEGYKGFPQNVLYKTLDGLEPMSGRVREVVSGDTNPDRVVN